MPERRVAAAIERGGGAGWWCVATSTELGFMACLGWGAQPWPRVAGGRGQSCGGGEAEVRGQTCSGRNKKKEELVCATGRALERPINILPSLAPIHIS
jgi:hypothetical protein